MVPGEEYRFSAYLLLTRTQANTEKHKLLAVKRVIITHTLVRRNNTCRVRDHTCKALFPMAIIVQWYKSSSLARGITYVTMCDLNTKRHEAFEI